MSVTRRTVFGVWLALLTFGHFIITSNSITLKSALMQMYRFEYIYQKTYLTFIFVLLLP